MFCDSHLGAISQEERQEISLVITNMMATYPRGQWVNRHFVAVVLVY